MDPSVQKNSEELRYLLALHRAPGIGPITFKDLIARFGSAELVFQAAPLLSPEGRLTASVLAYLKNPDWSAVEKDLVWAEHSSNHILTQTDEHYPRLLSQIHDLPPLLFVRGDPTILKQPQIAIVGSRNPSTMGSETTHGFGRGLVAAGLVVSSGMAYGIDAAAHEGALAGGGQTIAVAGTGLDRVYPAQHRDLAHRIAERGALVSEYPVGTPPLSAHFPRRNRILSGLALGVLVVEASLKSGSLITARFAIEHGREVFAIPGSIHDPLSKGCHLLLREGAKLVETVQDILEELRQWSPKATAFTPIANKLTTKTPEMPVLDEEYEKLLQHMGHDPLPIDTLVEYTGLTSASISSMLLILELQGLVIARPGGFYTRPSSLVPK